jgi:hypothetical protein
MTLWTVGLRADDRFVGRQSRYANVQEAPEKQTED